MNHHHDEVAKIMGVDEEAVKVLPRIKYEGNFMNPYGDALLDLFRLLDLTPQHTVLDIPCGQGGVAVYLAKEYGVTATGYDLLPGFINNANDHAAERGVQSRCRFYAADIRAAIEAGREYDLVLWSAPPRLWEDYRQTTGRRWAILENVQSRVDISSLRTPMSIPRRRKQSSRIMKRWRRLCGPLQHMGIL